MTKKGLLNNFPKPTFVGVCASCAYVETCTNILPNFIKPNKCGGPFDITHWMPLPEAPRKEDK